MNEKLIVKHKWESNCGKVKIYCCDSKQIINHITQDAVVVTDPPYGVNFTGSVTKHTNEKKCKTGYDSFHDTRENVRKKIVPIIETCIARFSRVCLTPGCACEREYPEPTAIGVIYYPSGANLCPWGFLTHQPIYYYGKCPYLKSRKGSRPTGFSTTESAEKGIKHPCPKPLKQMEWLVLRASLEGETVFDPFMGSGTTGIACLKSGRKFIGCEISESYFAEATRRLKFHLGYEVTSHNGVIQKRMFTPTEGATNV